MARVSKFAIVAAAMLSACGTVAEPDEPVPTEPADLHAWLAAGEYTAWSADPEVQPGLNGSGRRVYLSPEADPAGSPVGAAAVREIFVEDGDGWQQIGWSALVKVSDQGEPLDNWTFFETFDLEDPDAFAVAAPNAPGCASCHGGAPDVIQSPRRP